MGLSLDDAAWSSPWRTRSTLEKSVLCLGLLLVAATTTSVVVAGAVGICVLAITARARVPAGVWWRAMLGPAAFIGLGAVTIAVTFGGGDLVRWGPVGVGAGSASRALLVATRALAATAAMVLLAATTPMVDLLAGLRRARVPEVAVDIAAVTYRMIFSLLDVATSIRAAQAGRLGYASGGAARRSVGLLAAAVLVGAWDRARRLEEGLAGRGGVGAVPVVPARDVSTPFVVAGASLVLALAAMSLGAGLS
ncbi:cobalt ECF transporter T component CbiQ [Janibacter anophelis]|uniref:cobalt ECF transporter T component CbiQ n=1 Tax=Janibacter anophelis TaxID=319054 RepID=UPI00082ACFAF|nr:cobalt ECF transporter T component CbiQ [Janibacter anophelis]